MAGTKGRRNGGQILVNLFAMTAISRCVGSSRQHISLGKGIATWTVSVVMGFDSAILSIGGTCEGDDFS